jgi:hypothetical protein
VDFRRQHVAQVEVRKCGFVADHSLGLAVTIGAPEHEHGFLLELGRRVVPQPVDAPRDPANASLLQVVMERRAGEAEHLGLLRGEVAVLRFRKVVDVVPTLVHARFVSPHRTLL